ncbi:MAG: heat-shock protein Hsp20 [Nitrososphaerota archaeon]|mgnify:FL=1
MSEGPEDRWMRRRRLPSIFDEFDRMMREMQRWFEQEMREIERLMPRELVREVETPQGVRRQLGPIVWGYSITIGPDGKPIIREFGNFKPEKGGGIIREREPLVDIIEQADLIRVILEIPGVEKEDIDLKVTESKLTIRVDTADRKYHRTVELPEPVDPDSAKATYKNGILEVTLKKKRPPSAAEWKKVAVE